METKTENRTFLTLGLAVLVLAGVALSADAQGLEAKPVLDLNPNLQLEEGLENVVPEGVLTVGPDVTIIDLSGVDNYNSGGGSACPAGYGVGNCRGFAIGTNSCGRGTVPADWCDQNSSCRTTTDAYHPIAPATNTDHSVIGQNMYRLHNGRFEQIGASFLKHGFVSTNSDDNDCTWNDNGVENSACIGPPAGGDQLGLGCTDFYGAGLNGSRPLGRRSDVNVANADHPQNGAGGETNDNYDQRIVVAEADLVPSSDPSAPLYWMEGQYVVRDDARSGSKASPPAPFGEEGGGGLNAWLGENGHNNASYRAATVSNSLQVDMTGSTFRELAAIYAWQAVDPAVEIVNVDRQTFFLGDPIDPPAGPGNHPDHWVVERFEAARRVYGVSPVSEGVLPFRYEYAIHNINSDTSADGFVIDFPGSATFANVGFTDIDDHSGEPFDTTDWSIDVNEATGTITWTAADAGANTNALRWGTTFSFYFESNLPPTVMVHTLDLFKIDEMINVKFVTGSSVIFEDGFESGSTDEWDTVTP